jgi:hypothetical protein
MTTRPGGNPVNMPDRAIIPLLPAVSLGFICGIIVSTLQMQDGPTMGVALVGGVLTAIAALSSVLGVGGERSEKIVVGVLRAACAVGLFLSIFLFILTFLRDASILGSLIWIPLALAFALVIARMRVRDRGELDGTGESAEPA